MVGAKTERIDRVAGKKIDLTYSSFHSGPQSQELRSMVAHDIGACVWDKVPMIANTYQELDDAHLRIVYDHLSVSWSTFVYFFSASICGSTLMIFILLF